MRNERIRLCGMYRRSARVAPSAGLLLDSYRKHCLLPLAFACTAYTLQYSCIHVRADHDIQIHNRHTLCTALCV